MPPTRPPPYFFSPPAENSERKTLSCQRERERERNERVRRREKQRKRDRERNRQLEREREMERKKARDYRSRHPFSVYLAPHLTKANIAESARLSDTTSLKPTQ